MPSRIALVTYAMNCGGMESCLLRLGNYFRQQGCEVDVITTIEPGQWFARLADFDLRGIHVRGYRQSGILAPLKHSIRVSSTISQGNYDVVFLNHARHAQAALARLSDSVIAVPILHNHTEEIYQIGCANPNAWNAAVAVSPKVAAAARERVPHRPVLQLYYGVDIPDEGQWQRRRDMGRRLELIFVGRLTDEQKGVLWLPEIYQGCLAQGIDAALTIVGDGPDADLLTRRLLEFSSQGKVRHLKGLTPEAVYDLLLESHVLLAPSRYEGLPIGLLEGQACGCVPIASRLPGITDTAVEDGKTGLLVETGDVAGFVQAIAALYRDPARWSRMSRAGHDRIRRDFSVECMGAAYLRFITDAMEGRYPLPRRRRYQSPLDLSVFSWREFLPQPLRRVGREGRMWLKTFSRLAH